MDWTYSKEWNERRYITKVINATIHYAQSKLAGFPFHAQTERYGDVWRVILTIRWTPQPPAPKILPTFEDVGCVDGRLLSFSDEDEYGGHKSSPALIGAHGRMATIQ